MFSVFRNRNRQVSNQRFKDQLSSDGRYRNLREVCSSLLAKRLHRAQLPGPRFTNRSSLMKFNRRPFRFQLSESLDEKSRSRRHLDVERREKESDQHRNGRREERARKDTFREGQGTALCALVRNYPRDVQELMVPSTGSVGATALDRRLNLGGESCDSIRASEPNRS